MQLSPYIFGTTRLGHDDVPDERAIRVARQAMEAGLWFHTSRMYDDALEILGAAYQQDRSKLPPTIYKIGGKDIEEVRQVISDNLTPLSREKMEIGQISPTESIGEGLLDGSVVPEFKKIQDEGLVERYVMEVFPWTSTTVLQALRRGHLDGLVDAFIFYLNPLQRFASNELYSEIMTRELPIIAMRTVAGGNVHKLRDVPGAAWKPYLQERAAAVAPIFDKSGIEHWSEFCLRFAHSIPGVIASVGSSSRPEGLAELAAHAKNLRPLDPTLVSEITTLHAKWSDEVDLQAEPWTM